MTNDRIFLKVDLPSWIDGTIEKHEAGEDWNLAWRRTYAELGGTSEESGKKACPMAAARTLYKLGYILGYGSVQRLPLDQVSREYSKNGAYAVAAIECLKEDPTLSLAELWRAVWDRFRAKTGEEPALSNQGGPTLTFKLFKLGLLR